MTGEIKQVCFARLPKKRKRVAAYARVSSGKDAMLHSLSAQISYYNDLIQSHTDWLFSGVYADEALTGTKEDRKNFQRLIADCRAGKIDMVITKSISRFARNTVTLLETVRELKNTGVDVFFEEQNIHSASADGELMLTILASYAQEESLSVSENQKWRVRRNFESGIPWNGKMLGYRLADGQYIIVPDEAKIVKRIFTEYLSGSGTETICKRLNSSGIPAVRGREWHPSAISHILRNYTYTGNLLLQKTFSENHITKRTLPNRGELPQYHVSDSHEAIIPLDMFTAAQEEMKRRSKKSDAAQPKAVYPFTGLITCGICGKHYRRKTTAARPIWICPTYNVKGKSCCPSKQIPEDTLTAISLDILGADTLEGIRDGITAITAENGNIMTFTLSNGEKFVKHWRDRSRSESWTEEMKEAARQKVLERNKK